MDWGSEKYRPLPPLILLLGVVIFLQSQAARAPPAPLKTFPSSFENALNQHIFWNGVWGFLVWHEKLLNIVVYGQPYFLFLTHETFLYASPREIMICQRIMLWLAWIVMYEPELLFIWITYCTITVRFLTGTGKFPMWRYLNCPRGPLNHLWSLFPLV